MYRLLASLLGLCSTVAAQIFIVDAANGPGTHFLAIDVAVAAVPDGSVLIVRAGTYGPFTVAAKGLTITGEPGAAVQLTSAAPISIGQTSANQRVIVRDVAIVAPPGSSSAPPLGVVCQQTQGPVALQRLTVSGSLRLQISSGAQVCVEHCGPFTAGPGFAAMRLDASSVVCNTCSAYGGYTKGVWLVNSSAQLIDCTVQGGIGLPFLVEPAVEISNGSELRLTGFGMVQGMGGGAAIVGQGVVRRDPSVVVGGAVTATSYFGPLAWLIANGGQIGTTATATMVGWSGQLGVLFLGEIGGPLLVPGIQNEIWLAPSNLVSMAAGVFGPNLVANVAVPNTPLLLGSMFAWQGVTLDPMGALTMTTPTLLAP